MSWHNLPVSSRLINNLATTDALADVFSDETVLQLMLDVEAALARAQARYGVFPARAADAIAAAANAADFDPITIARAAVASGSPAIPLVKALTDRVRATDPDSARFVHWGATSQDVTDTALVLCIDRAQAILARDHARLLRALRHLSDRHSSTVMLGRTLLQPAPPITFGLKVAGWFGAVSRAWARLSASVTSASVIQLGGASGTLAALGDDGIAIGRALAADLRLGYPDAPWHTHRDRLAAVVADCGIYTGTLGKIARDISLLMQEEVGEAAEPGGGSSTMPHKRNPSGCAIVLAAATRVPGLVATFLAGMPQEHERAVGGLHAEWPTVASTVQTTGSALAAITDVAEQLIVRPDRMRMHIDATRGTIFAERVMMMIAGQVGRDVAHKLLADAVQRSIATAHPFGDVLRSMPEITKLLSADDLRDIDDPESYLGVADILRMQLLRGGQ